MRGLKIIAGAGAALFLTACASSAAPSGTSAGGTASNGSPAPGVSTATGGGSGSGGGSPDGGGTTGTGTGSTGKHKIEKAGITGTLFKVGTSLGAGSEQPTPTPISGTVQFVSLRHGTFSASVGSSGHFSARLPIGSYHITGRSPEVTDSSGTQTPCIRPAAVNVTLGKVVNVTVACITS
ncbi:MAG: hypothetical protein ABJB47_17900 [Actinomycetota bacterium]